MTFTTKEGNKITIEAPNNKKKKVTKKVAEKVIKKHFPTVEIK